MSWLLRPSILLLAWATLTAGAVLLLVRPPWQALPANQALPQPVPAGDQEVVWLNAATNAVAWERFVAAAQMLTQQPELGVDNVDDANAFPNATTAAPELAISVRGSKARLWFRWYKLTGDLEASQWVNALTARQPAPLAIIGGGSSDRARDLALALEASRVRMPSPPLLLITTATAEKVDLPGQPQKDLIGLYPDRTLRFCYTDGQMAQAVVDFIWSQPELRPDREPVYLASWSDDPYSKDLFDRFREVLRTEQFANTLRGADELALPATPFWSAEIPYSVGAFSQPNRWESEWAEKLADALSQHPDQHRPLLVLPAIPQPARRLLRALLRTVPVGAGRFTVATGDGVDFNTIYRDRRLAWNIQDLPFSLVLFCHRNPVDPVAFQPDDPDQGYSSGRAAGTATGTQDLLLYRDIAATVVTAAFRHGALQSDSEKLRAGLRAAVQPDGRPRFEPDGDPRGGLGEFIVSLRPVRMDERVLPQAILQVWKRIAEFDGTKEWVRVAIAGQPELRLEYLPSR